VSAFGRTLRFLWWVGVFVAGSIMMGVLLFLMGGAIPLK
jgi:hypothetical protein